MNNDILASIIGIVMGLAMAPTVALLIVALLRGRQARKDTLK